MSGKPNSVEEHRKLCKARCDAALRGLVGQELVATWWTSSNKAFDDRTPEQMWQDDYERVYRYVMQHAFR